MRTGEVLVQLDVLCPLDGPNLSECSDHVFTTCFQSGSPRLYLFVDLRTDLASFSFLLVCSKHT